MKPFKFSVKYSRFKKLLFKVKKGMKDKPHILSMLLLILGILVFSGVAFYQRYTNKEIRINQNELVAEEKNIEGEKKDDQNDDPTPKTTQSLKPTKSASTTITKNPTQTVGFTNTPTATPTPINTLTPTNTPAVTTTPTITPTPTTTSRFAKIISPNGGETLQQGSNYSVTWQTSSDITSVSLLYILSTSPEGANYIIQNIPNTGSYTWNVLLNGVTAPVQVKLEMVAHHSGGSFSDRSDNYFTVLPNP